MAANDQRSNHSKKRKQIPGSQKEGEKPFSKKPKFVRPKPTNPPNRALKKPFQSSHNRPVKAQSWKSDTDQEKKEPKTKRELRLQAKELTEARKKKRKRHYTLELELASLWEKMRRRNIAKEERSKLVSGALQKMKGKITEIAGSHVSSRVLQTCVKYCSSAERDAVFEELRPHLLTLACNTYAVHLVKKMLDNASKKQLEGFISSLHGHVAPLLRHMVGSVESHLLRRNVPYDKYKGRTPTDDCTKPESCRPQEISKDNVNRRHDPVCESQNQERSPEQKLVRNMKKGLRIEEGKVTLILGHSHKRVLRDDKISSFVDLIPGFFPAVIEQAYQLGNASQKQGLLLELYSTELQLFKDLVSMKESRLVDLISKLGLQKASVIRHMTSVIQPILEKGIVDHSIIHSALMEYFSIADKSSAADAIQQLSGPLLVRMIHTRDGSKVGMLCVKHGSAKERKKIIKGMKGHIGKIAHDQYGSMVLVCIISTVDDTKLITKIVIRELQTILKELVLEKGEGAEINSDLEKQTKSSEVGESGDKVAESDAEATVVDIENSTNPSESLQLVEGGKKDPSLRILELLVNSGLAENLVDTCIERAGDLLKSNFGKEVIYEVATGGVGSFLQPTLADKLDALHVAIASLAAVPKTEESEEEHVLENFHSSRTIRKLVLDCPAFASTLWKIALQGKCEMWAQGHSGKVVCALLESSDPNVQNLARPELQPLIDGGILKIPETKPLAKEVTRVG
ncbi:hypothetical protein HHK36_012353 [Tetracentron sinense]|uniref:PUM-HD domain-containing protein n=1 Tax=Tetracentron sinense TaxID=13715 RepID=A0A834Z5M9_TETSI|nr:hypothetical protein HHK36_012353 [Tetracentron sinense]